MTAIDGQLVACHECDALYRREPLAPGSRASCTRCGALLYRHIPNALNRSIALFLASLVLLILANAFPFLALKVGGQFEQDHVFGSSWALVEFGMTELGLVVFLTSIAFPFITIVGTLYMLLAARANVVAPGLPLVFRMVRMLGPWSLLGVFLLGTLIAIVKLRDLAVVVPGPGLFALFALVIIYSAARSAFDSEMVWAPLDIPPLTEQELRSEQAPLNCHTCFMLNHPTDEDGQATHRCVRCHAPVHSRHENSLQRTGALMAAAIVMLIPANLLPIMTVTQLGRGEPSTIISGVIHLIEAGMWGLGLIVFFASVVVPLAKLSALGYLLRSVGPHSRRSPRDRTLLYRVTEMIGAWSMVDVFLVGLLAGLVSLGILVTIEPGLGATFFAAAVILTMLAAHSFDPRLIWDHIDETDTGEPSASANGALELAR